VFLPKYLENHYGIPQTEVGIYMAIFGVLGFACGTVTGGFITRRWKLNGRTAAIYVLTVSLINTALFFSKSFLGCHSIVNGVGRSGISTVRLLFAGLVQQGFQNFNYTTTCNLDCGCESAGLFPVCDISGKSFYSPCHAGCRVASVVDIDTYDLEFSECDCMPNAILKKSYCHNDCRIMVFIISVPIHSKIYSDVHILRHRRLGSVCGWNRSGARDANSTEVSSAGAAKSCIGVARLPR